MKTSRGLAGLGTFFLGALVEYLQCLRLDFWEVLLTPGVCLWIGLGCVMDLLDLERWERGTVKKNHSCHLQIPGKSSA